MSTEDINRFNLNQNVREITVIRGTTVREQLYCYRGVYFNERGFNYINKYRDAPLAMTTIGIPASADQIASAIPYEPQ